MHCYCQLELLELTNVVDLQSCILFLLYFDLLLSQGEGDRCLVLEAARQVTAATMSLSLNVLCGEIYHTNHSSLTKPKITRKAQITGR